ncbi:MAG: hypothetical protein QXE79_03840 [Candidatus Bathyarchaeia archaeon]
MPQRIMCGRCGFTLYEGAEVKQPVEVILQYDGRCPGCGKPLEYSVDNIRLKILNQRE